MSSQKKFDEVYKTLSFRFENEDAARHFKTWLCDSGEQSYWDWMAEQEVAESGPITGTEFDYWDRSTIRVKCGRLDE